MIARSSENIFVLTTALAALIIRISAIFLFVDLNNPQMWEFGMIARNLLNGEGFTFLALTHNVPSAFMPPGLPFIYYFIFSIFGDNSAGYVVILFINAVLSAITAVISYYYAKRLFNKSTAVFTIIYITFSPILIYSSISFNSIIIYQFLLLLVFLLLDKIIYTGSGSKIIKNDVFKYVIYISFVLGLFLYFRAESVFFILAISALFMFKKKFSYAFLVVLFSVLIISPWTIRNFNTFGKFIPVTSSFGYNFYFGHGDDASTLVYKEKLAMINEDVNFEINQSQMALDLAVKYITSHPIAEVRESVKKVYSLWIIDAYRDSAKEPVYLFVWIPTLLFFLTGTYFIFRQKSKLKQLSPVYFYLIFSTLLTVVFFNIPRYQIQMSIIMLPIAMYGLTELISKYKSKTIRK